MNFTKKTSELRKEMYNDIQEIVGDEGLSAGEIIFGISAEVGCLVLRLIERDVIGDLPLIDFWDDEIESMGEGHILQISNTSVNLIVDRGLVKKVVNVPLKNLHTVEDVAQVGNFAVRLRNRKENDTKRILLEGTKEEVRNLKKILRAASYLPKELNGRYLKNLWSEDDVHDDDMPSEEKQVILHKALNNPYVIEKINETIEYELGFL